MNKKHLWSFLIHSVQCVSKMVLNFDNNFVKC